MGPPVPSGVLRPIPKRRGDSLELFYAAFGKLMLGRFGASMQR